jgi:hypothetical protein
MIDVLMTVLLVAAFGIAAVYVAACRRVTGDRE